MRHARLCVHTFPQGTQRRRYGIATLTFLPSESCACQRVKRVRAGGSLLRGLQVQDAGVMALVWLFCVLAIEELQRPAFAILGGLRGLTFYQCGIIGDVGL